MFERPAWKHHALLKNSSSRYSIDPLYTIYLIQYYWWIVDSQYLFGHVVPMVFDTSEACLLVYGWTLVAPKILSNRSFWTGEKDRCETLCGTWIFHDFSQETIFHIKNTCFVGLRSEKRCFSAPSWIGRSSILYIDNALQHRKTAAAWDMCAEFPSVSYLKYHGC